MLAKILSTSYLGVEGFLVVVEVDISTGLPAFELVGLATTAVREARERVRLALKNSPFPFPNQRITVNLAPADIPKQGSYFDLPIALGILVAQGILPQRTLDNYAIIGELSLDGNIKPIRGALAMALTVKELNISGLILPTDNYHEASAVKQIKLIPVNSLIDVVSFLQTGKFIKPPFLKSITFKNREVDFKDIKGQAFARRGIEIAAAGGHNLLLMGPPGSGKTLLAKAFSTILPPLTEKESLEVTRIHSIAGLINHPSPLITQRPFRQPHHNITPAGLIGGGRIPLPGEISLAHHGVLFLDEMTEFKRDLLDQLRQPLEMKKITITRNRYHLSFPANFLLIGAANHCKCGFYGDPTGKCTCSVSEIKKYFQRISGPLLDRIDIQIQVSRVLGKDLFSSTADETSEIIQKRIIRVREIQKNRYQNETFYLNSQIPPGKMELYCPMGEKAKKNLTQVLDKLQLTMRKYHQIIKIARTLADLRQAENIEYEDIAEAIQYHSIERIYR